MAIDPVAGPEDDLEALTRLALPRTLGIASAVIAMIGDEHRESPTRCDGYTVELLVGHLINGLAWFAAAGVGRMYDPTTRPDPDLHGRSLAEAYDTAADAVRLAWGSAAPFRVAYDMPSGPADGAALGGYVCLEQIGHAFDLADAAGGPILLPDDVAAGVLAIGAILGDDVLRAPGMFGVEHTPHEGASSTDRVRAFLGRPPR
jgi:uncharacterized protein (TIGR03086 family)